MRPAHLLSKVFQYTSDLDDPQLKNFIQQQRKERLRIDDLSNELIEVNKDILDAAKAFIETAGIRNRLRGH